MTPPDIEPGKLVWRCRRGMRELDVLFNQFLERRYAQLDAEAQHAFIEFLDTPDPDIYAFLTGQQKPPEARHQRVVDELLALN